MLRETSSKINLPLHCSAKNKIRIDFLEQIPFSGFPFLSLFMTESLQIYFIIISDLLFTSLFSLQRVFQFLTFVQSIVNEVKDLGIWSHEKTTICFSLLELLLSVLSLLVSYAILIQVVNTSKSIYCCCFLYYWQSQVFVFLFWINVMFRLWS